MRRAVATMTSSTRALREKQALPPPPPVVVRRVRRTWRRTLYLVSLLFDPIRWIWSTVLLGGLGVALLTGLAQTGVVGVGQWTIFAWLQEHREQGTLYGSTALALLLTITYVTWRAQRVPIVRAWRARYRPIEVADLRLTNAQFNLGTKVYERFYFKRAAYERACDEVRKVRRNRANGKRGIIIVGDTMVGKTRLALEVIRAELPDYDLLKWPRDANPDPASLNAYRRMRLVVLIDDLQSFAQAGRAPSVLEALDPLLDNPQLVIVATSWGGTYWSGASGVSAAFTLNMSAVSTAFAHLIDLLTKIELGKLNEDEKAAFFAELARKGIPYDEQDKVDSDDTVGSVLLGLASRIAQLGSMEERPLAILKSLRLLRSAKTISFPQARIQRVARGVFLETDGDRRVSTIPQRVYDGLRDDGWITITPGDGKRFLSVAADAYLDKCVAAVYPSHGARIEDDFQRLQIALTRGGAEESEALFALSDAYLDEHDLPADVRYERAQSAVKAGLAPLDVARNQDQLDLWIDGQLKLARLFRDMPLGEPSDNHQRARAAYSVALAAATESLFPADLTSPASILHTARFRQKVNKRASIAEVGIEAVQAALLDVSRESSPKAWAGLQSNLGSLYLYRRRGHLQENIRQALDAYDAALVVYDADDSSVYEGAITRTGRIVAHLLAAPLETRATAFDATEAAQLLNEALQAIEKRGTEFERAFVLAARGSVAASDPSVAPADALSRARANFDQALALLGRASPYQADRALISAKIGMACVQLGQTPEDLNQATRAFDLALDILNKDDFRPEWALAYGYRAIVYVRSLNGALPQDPARAARDLDTARRALPFDQYPYEWSLLSWHLAVAFEAMSGPRDVALQNAVAAYEDCLSVFTRESFPLEWALTQQALGTVLIQRVVEVKRDAAEGLTRAQAAYDQALQVLSRSEHPVAWATIQANLGEVVRMTARDREALAEAEERLRQALEVFRGPDFALEAAAVQNNLGALYLKLGETKRAEEILRPVLEIFKVLGLQRQQAVVQSNLSAALAERADAGAVDANALLEEADRLNREARGLLLELAAPYASEAAGANQLLLEKMLQATRGGWSRAA